MKNFPVIHNTNRLLIFSYPINSGGKFVANCLALSTHCHAQHRDLLGVSHADFNSELHSRLDVETGVWNDLRMGCEELFGFDWESEDWNDPLLPQHVLELCEHDVYFCKTAHGDAIVKSYKSLFPNAQVINFVNCDDFILKRGGAWFQPDIVVDSVYTWDCDWFMSAHQTMKGIHNLYNTLDMPDWNSVKDYIEPYRQRWLRTILT